jgi:hypothetical protein
VLEPRSSSSRLICSNDNSNSSKWSLKFELERDDMMMR